MSKLSVEQFKEKLNNNLIKSTEDMSNGNWVFSVDKEEDSFTWRNPNSKTNENSILLPLEDKLTMCVNPDTAEINYFFVEYFTEYIKENPSLKALIQDNRFAVKSFIGKVRNVKKNVKINTAAEALMAKVFLNSFGLAAA